MKNGIDVSKWQGTPDWEAVKASGVEFVILRAGYGASTSQKDSTFDYNYSECVRLGIPVGAYWYAYWQSGTPEQEVAAFLACIEGKSLECGAWYDVEYEPNILALSNAERTDYTIRALKAIEAGGLFAGLYASTDMINNRMEYARLSPYAIWAAQYNTVCTCKAAFGMWQNSSSGAISGISGSVDTDIMYNDYPEIIVNNGLTGVVQVPAIDAPTEDDATTPNTTVTLRIDPATRGDVKTMLEKAFDLDLFVMGTLEIGPVTAGDETTIRVLAESLGLGVTEV